MKRTAFLTFVVGALVGFAACYLLLIERAQEDTSTVTLQPDQPRASAQPQQVPNAAEVFRLRSECAKMGEKVLAANVAGVGPELTQEQVSHYEPRTAHCYVQVYIRGPDLTKYAVRYLFDGQTNELLAASGIENGKMMRMDSLPEPRSMMLATT